MRIDSGFVEPVRFRCRRRPTINLTRPRTRSSNPVPSSGESTNFRFPVTSAEKLGEATGTQPKSLIRMFGPRGNPQARNLFSVLGYLQKQAGLQLHVTAGPA
jgi:hypothetical protein